MKPATPGGSWNNAEKLSSTSNSMSRKTNIQHINFPPAKIRRIESFQVPNQTKLKPNVATTPTFNFAFKEVHCSQEDEEEDDDEIPNPHLAPVVVMETNSSDSSDGDDTEGYESQLGGDYDEKPIVGNYGGSNMIEFLRTHQQVGGSKGRKVGASATSKFSAVDGAIPRQGDISGGSSNGSGTGAGGICFDPVSKFGYVTVQWLLENYETAEGVSLPRSTLYFHYLRHCDEHKIDPVNAASFGKLIRSVFVGLRTRRLGTRGNSKYHYYGIRLKPTSPLVNVVVDGEESSQGGQTGSPGSGDGDGATPAKKIKTSFKGEHYEVSHHGAGVNLTDPYSIQKFLGNPSVGLENLPELDIKMGLPNELNVDHLLIFKTLYREHCETLLDMITNFQLNQIEGYWKQFWRNSSAHGEGMEPEYEKMLPKEKLMMLCNLKEIQNFVRNTDYQFYQNIVGLLLPNVLRPIPSAMTQSIRNFAKSVEGWLTGAMHGYPGKVVTIKITCASALAQTLRRYTSLNHLAQAARAVLQNENQISQMLSDLNRVDFHNVEEQAAWVCGCDGNIAPSVEQDFKATLAQQHTLEQWAIWLESVVDKCLSSNGDPEQFVKMARHFLLKWSFYSSLVIRDLTLRSASSFGSFHLLRLLYDEYMFYLVENRVAHITGTVPIAVIGKKILGAGVVGMDDDTHHNAQDLRGRTYGSTQGSNASSPSSISSDSPTSATNVSVSVNTNSSVGNMVTRSEKRAKNFLTA